EADPTLCNPTNGERLTSFGDGRKRVNDHAAGLMLTNNTLDVHQVDFRAEGLSARRMHPQHAALQMRAEANAHRGKVAHDFGRIFVKADVKRAFLAQTRSLGKGAREDGFARAC